MKNLTTIIFIFLTLIVFGQKKDIQTIHVTGIARITIKPDLGILSISVSENKSKMGEAIKAIGEKSNYYYDLLRKLGFDEKDIKTTNFEVSKNRVYKDGEYSDNGYLASQNIRLQFIYEQKTLFKILSEFSMSEESIDFNFKFELSENLKQKVQSQIIDNAVKDGNDKANSIAKSSGLKLIKIKEITYGTWNRESGMELVENNYEYVPPPIKGGNGFQYNNFTPDDLIFRDSVTIIWIVE